jgi:hypothetical protein
MPCSARAAATTQLTEEAALLAIPLAMRFFSLRMCRHAPSVWWCVALDAGRVRAGGTPRRGAYNGAVTGRGKARAHARRAVSCRSAHRGRGAEAPLEPAGAAPRAAARSTRRAPPPSLVDHTPQVRRRAAARRGVRHAAPPCVAAHRLSGGRRNHALRSSHVLHAPPPAARARSSLPHARRLSARRALGAAAASRFAHSQSKSVAGPPEGVPYAASKPLHARGALPCVARRRGAVSPRLTPVPATTGRDG